MSYSRVLTVQDISCVGQCSLTVALPIISACGHETCVLPSAVLSTHTGGFTGYTFRDLTDDMPKILAHWQKESLDFDALYTGYLGSAKQISYVLDIYHSVLRKGGYFIVDPAMADNGKLYYGFDDAFVAEMRKLCHEAHIILPNITEACLLTGIEYREQYDRAYIDRLLQALAAICPGTIVLTGVSFHADKNGVCVYRDGSFSHYEHERIAGGFHGTGDVYASAFTGALMGGKDVESASRIAADYTVRCILETKDDPNHRYGVKFEKAIPYLLSLLG